MNAYFEKLYKGTAERFYSELKNNLSNKQKRFIVTANPEAFMLGKNDNDVNSLLISDKTTVVADGIGLVKGAKIVGYNIEERIPGVEIAQRLLEYANELSCSVYLFGAAQEVLSALCEKINKDYPHIKIAGSTNGFVEDKNAVFEKINELQPDIVMVALGMPMQEKLIFRHLENFEKGIFIGVGGSFDVLSGTKLRAPEFFIKHNIEWLYRIAKEPKRLKRFYNNNIKFLFKLKKKK